MPSIDNNLSSPTGGPNFFQLPPETQAKYRIPTIRATTKYPGWKPRFQTPYVNDIPWSTKFEDRFGIVEYTRRFVWEQETRGIVVQRRSVEVFWVGKVAERFRGEEGRRGFFVQQLNCALINDCWNRDDFEIETLKEALIQDPSRVRDPIGLRVLLLPKRRNEVWHTVMMINDTETRKATSERGILTNKGAVWLPYLGLHSLSSIEYLDVARQVRRGDGQPPTEELMHEIWRGIIFNMFYFESDEAKLEKLSEEDWTLIEVPTGAGESPSNKRKFGEDLEEARNLDDGGVAI